ncbi:MAG TPA: S8 family peptidase [Bryobacteraceae bacterium]|nr:S8 family peptidase [Bryobacteraceae bacterium]
MRLTRVTALFIALSVPACFAGNISPDLEQQLPQLGLFSSTNVIVQLNVPLASPLVNEILLTGTQVLAQLPLVNGLLCSVSGIEIRLLSALPIVSYITPDRTLAGALDYAEPAVNANVAMQYGWTGSGIGVAVIDSGIAPVADLTYNGTGLSRLVYSENFADRSGNTSDQFGHGTHVAGILAGDGAASTGSWYTRTFMGIAPAAEIVNLRVLNGQGQGSDSAVIRAIFRAIQLKSQYNIRVMNLSLGRPVYESYLLDPLCIAVEAAWRAGIVVVVAAGNNGRDNSQGENGYGTINSPGNDPAVVTVGAMKTMFTVTRADDLIASYSSKGPTTYDNIVKPDIVAPGNLMVSLLAPNSWLSASYPQNDVPDAYYESGNVFGNSTSYYRLSGTSMATPVVSGAAALLLQQNPSLTPDEIKLRLMKTATKNFPTSSIATDPTTGATYTSYYDVFTVGAGYIDVWAALNDSTIAWGSARSPEATYDPTSGTATFTLDPFSAFANNVVWGGNVVWGASTGTRANVVWGSGNPVSASSTFRNVVWGSGDLAAESASAAIYGEN